MTCIPFHLPLSQLPPIPAMNFLEKSPKPIMVNGLNSMTHPPSSSSSKQNGQHQAIAQSHQIFSIPEILERILSFLSIRTLRYRASFVCRLWRRLSFRIESSFLPITATWISSLDTAVKKFFFKNALAFCSSLHLSSVSKHYCSLSPEKRVAVWGELQEYIISEFSSNKTLRITQLSVEGNLPLSTTVDQLLMTVPSLSKMLTTIRIEKYCAEPVYHIDILLSTCVNLLDLHLEALPSDLLKPVQLELRPESDLWLNKTETSLRLRRLTIKYWHVSSKVMEILLPHCRLVKSLELVDISRLSPPLSLFYRLVAGCLPSLEHIQITCQYDRMQLSDAIVFQQVFNRVRSWSIDPRDIQEGTWWLRESVPPALTPQIIFPTLTSLSIIGGRFSFGYDQCSDIIHTYLISPAAESLVHLKVNRYRFRLVYRNPDLPYDGKPWTCRRLETLHLDMLNDNRVTTSAPDSRIILNYLTQLLPRMRTLTLKFNVFDFSLYGGLCFLKRMRYLESAYLGSKLYGAISKRDLHWLGTSSTVPTVFWKNWMTQLWSQQHSTTLSSWKKSLKDLNKCLQDSDDDGGSLPCLESLILETIHLDSRFDFRKSDADMVQFMKSLRPDCYFRIIRQREN